MNSASGLGRYVGQLQEKWQFPSDHLPIGICLDDLRIISWNILNQITMHWLIEKDVLGLKDSLIGKRNIPYESGQITQREYDVYILIDTMLNNGMDLLCIQECGLPFLKELRSRIDTNVYGIIGIYDDECRDRNIVIYRRKKLTYVEVESRNDAGIYSAKPFRCIQNLVFENRAGARFRVVNTRIPGEPGNPAPSEFLTYLLSQTQKQTGFVLATGDMNITEVQMQSLVQKHGLPYRVIAPYCTNIEPITFRSKAIDHFLIPEGTAVRIMHPNEVLPDLERHLSLLQ